jgi:hypothetical protein
MADPRIKAYYDYLGKRDINQLFPVDDRSLNQRRAQAQQLREMGVHVATPKAKPAELNFGKNLGRVPISIGALGGMTQKEVDKASKSAAASLQAINDYGTIPLYFTPMAPAAAAFDVSRGIINEDPYEIGLAVLGVGRPLKSVPQTISEEAEKALAYAFGSGAVGTQVMQFLKNLNQKTSEE